MRLAIDTNAFTALVDGDEQVIGLIESANEVLVPFVVLAELRAGFSVGKRAKENELRLREFLALDDVVVAWADAHTVSHYVAVYKELRRLGLAVPANDLWIAAIALQHRAPLLTADAHFERIPGLQVVCR